MRFYVPKVSTKSFAKQHLILNGLDFQSTKSTNCTNLTTYMYCNTKMSFSTSAKQMKKDVNSRDGSQRMRRNWSSFRKSEWNNCDECWIEGEDAYIQMVAVVGNVQGKVSASAHSHIESRCWWVSSTGRGFLVRVRLCGEIHEQSPIVKWTSQAYRHSIVCKTKWQKDKRTKPKSIYDVGICILYY